MTIKMKLGQTYSKPPSTGVTTVTGRALGQSTGNSKAPSKKGRSVVSGNGHVKGSFHRQDGVTTPVAHQATPAPVVHAAPKLASKGQEPGQADSEHDIEDLEGLGDEGDAPEGSEPEKTSAT